MTNRDSSDVFETLVVAAAMDWARCSQLVVFFLLRLLLLGRDFPPISEQFSVILVRVRSKLVRFPNPLALPKASEVGNLTRSKQVQRNLK